MYVYSNYAIYMYGNESKKNFKSTMPEKEQLEEVIQSILDIFFIIYAYKIHKTNTQVYSDERRKKVKVLRIANAARISEEGIFKVMLDSGSQVNILSERSIKRLRIQKKIQIKKIKNPLTVQGAGGHISELQYKASIGLLEDAYVMPNGQDNLFSLSKLCKKGYSVLFLNNGSFEIYKGKNNIHLDSQLSAYLGKKVFSGQEEEGIYMVDSNFLHHSSDSDNDMELTDENMKSYPVKLEQPITEKMIAEVMNFHRSTGHMPGNIISQGINNGTFTIEADGRKISSTQVDKIFRRRRCVSCVIAQLNKKQHNKGSNINVEEPGHSIGWDYIPVKVTAKINKPDEKTLEHREEEISLRSINGFQGFYLFVDYATGYLMAVPVRSEQEAAVAFLKMVFHLKRNKMNPAYFYSDCAQSLTSEKLHKIAAQLQIELKGSPAKSHHRNKVERYVQIIVKKTATLLADQTILNERYWDTALIAAVSYHNRTPNFLCEGQPPISKIQKQYTLNPKEAFKYPFGLPIGVRLDSDNERKRNWKFGQVAHIGVYVGPNEFSAGLNFLMPGRPKMAREHAHIVPLTLTSEEIEDKLTKAFNAAAGRRTQNKDGGEENEIVKITFQNLTEDEISDTKKMTNIMSTVTGAVEALIPEWSELYNIHIDNYGTVTVNDVDLHLPTLTAMGSKPTAAQKRKKYVEQIINDISSNQQQESYESIIDKRSRETDEDGIPSPVEIAAAAEEMQMQSNLEVIPTLFHPGKIEKKNRKKQKSITTSNNSKKSKRNDDIQACISLECNNKGPGFETKVQKIKQKSFFRESTNLNPPPSQKENETGKETKRQKQSHTYVQQTTTNRFGRMTGREKIIAMVKLQSEQSPTMKSALSSDSKDRDLWIDAIQQEIRTIYNNDTFSLISEKNVRNSEIIPTKFILKIKKDNKFKARLVVRGDMEKLEDNASKQDFYAPTAHLKTFLFLMSLSAKTGMHMSGCDITGAFLHAVIQEDVYVRLPDNELIKNIVEEISGKKTEGRIVWKLKKTLYGLRKSPKAFNEHYARHLRGRGYKQAISDPCLFYKSYADGNMLYALIHVDDTAIFATHQNLIKIFKDEIKMVYKITDQKDLDYFCGISVVKNSIGDIKLHQEEYIQKIILKYDVEDKIKTQQRPTRSPEALERDQHNGGSKKYDKNKYQSLLGALAYLTRTQPELSYGVNRLSEKNQDPTHSDYNGLIHIIGYLKYIINIDRVGIVYRRDLSRQQIKIMETDVVFQAYADASYASHHDSKSHLGYLLTLENQDSPFSIFSQKEKTISTGSAQAELNAVFEVTKEIIFWRNFAEELGFTIDRPTKIYEDNQAVITLTHAYAGKAKKIKHFLMRVHYIGEKAKENCIKLVYCNTKDQLADGLTKHMGPNADYIFSRILGHHDLQVKDFPYHSKVAGSNVIKSLSLKMNNNDILIDEFETIEYERFRSETAKSIRMMI